MKKNENVKQKILGIIIARGQSKRIPRKNLKLLNSKPLISYSIKAALASKIITDVIVSTENLEIARVAKKYGARIPFMRPESLASDNSLVFPVIQHAVTEIEKIEGKIDKVVLIQSTSPLVISEDIDGAIQKMVTEKTSSCVSIKQVKDRPEWMFFKKGIKFVPYTTPSSLRTQDLPELYCLNGAVYVSSRDTIMKRNRLTDWDNMSAYVMPQERSVDIDEIEDFELAEFLMGKQGNEK